MSRFVNLKQEYAENQLWKRKREVCGMKGNGKLIGFLIGIIFVLATIVVAYVYKDDIVGCLKKLKNKLAAKAE